MDLKEILTAFNDKKVLNENIEGKVKLENAQEVASATKSIIELEEKVTDLTDSLEKMLDGVEESKKITELEAKTRQELSIKEEKLLETYYAKEKTKKEQDKQVERVQTLTGNKNFTAQSIDETKSAILKSGLGKKVGGGAGGFAMNLLNSAGKLMEAGTSTHLAFMQKEQAVWVANQKTRMNTLKAGAEMFQRNIKLVGKTQEAVFGSVVAQITQGANEGAYAAAQSMADVATQGLQTSLANEQTQLQLTMDNRMVQLERDQQIQKANHEIAKQAVGAVSTIVSCIPGVGGVIGGILSSLAESAVNSYTRIAEAETEMEMEKAKMEMEYEMKKIEAINNALSSAMEMAAGMAKMAMEFSKNVEETVKQTENISKQTANGLGMSSNQIANYEKDFFKMQANLQFKSKGKTIYLDKNAEDMSKIQSSYNEATGRNQVMTNDDMVQTFALGKVLGDDQLASSLVGSMDYFNKSIADGSEMIYNMYQKANKAGVSNKKFAQDLQQNLKMAQKYTFQGGVKGMMEMSIWAQKTRFNMQSIEGVIDKGLSGGLEGVIEQSAKLQVLGGNAAMLSNPLAMMYEMGNDPGALMKRINESIKGFGSFNSKTGEVDFSMNDTLQLRSIADAYGMDATELRNQATQAVKSQKIDNYLNGDIGEENKALLYSKAFYEDGAWKVNVNGKKTDVNNIGANDWTALKPTEEAMLDHVAAIHSIIAQDKGVKNYSNGTLANETKDEIQAEQQTRVDEALALVTDSDKREALKESIVAAAEHVTTAQIQANEQLLSSTENIKTYFDTLEKQTKQTIKNIQDEKSQFNLALSAVNAKANGLARTFENLTNELANSMGIIPKNEAKAASDMALLSEFYNQDLSTDHVDDKLIQKFKDIVNAGDNVNKIQEIVQDITGYGTWSTEDKGFKKMNKGLKTLFRDAELNNSSAKDLQKMIKEVISTPTTNTGDGVASAHGKSMITSAASVTPINDGKVQIAKSHPQDTAIFAKVGGPFDTLFNGVFGQINSIYSTLFGNTPKPLSIDLNMSGQITLNTNGSYIDISNDLRESPTFAKTITNLIIGQLSNNLNGGKKTLFKQFIDTII